MNKEKIMIEIILNNLIEGADKKTNIEHFVQKTPEIISSNYESKYNLVQKYNQLMQKITVGKKRCENELLKEVNNTYFKNTEKKLELKAELAKEFSRMLKKDALEIHSSSKESRFLIFPTWVFDTNSKTKDSLFKIFKERILPIINKPISEIEEQKSGQSKLKQHFNRFKKLGIIRKEGDIYKLTTRGIILSKKEDWNISDIFGNQLGQETIRNAYFKVLNVVTKFNFKNIEDFTNKVRSDLKETKLSIKKNSEFIPMSWFLALICGNTDFLNYYETLSIYEIFDVVVEVVRKKSSHNRFNFWRMKGNESRPHESILSSLEWLSEYEQNSSFDKLSKEKELSKYSFTFLQKGIVKFKRNPFLPAIIKEASNFSCEACLRPTFLNKANGKMYVEAHHIIPLQHYSSMEKKAKLDVLENMISLCPNCHAEAHQGISNKDSEVIKKMFKKISESNEFATSHKVKDIKDLIAKYE